MKLSIITINYNNLEGLKRTYESVVAQTCQEFEWIVIDGGSTDGSKEFIEANQDRFAFWCSEPDKGIYNAMNKGIAKALGDYLQFLNSGDQLVDMNVIRDFVSSTFGEDVISGDLIVNLDNNMVWHNPEEEMLDFDYPLYGTVMHPPSFIRKKLFESFGLYDESYRIVSDYKFFIEVLILHGCSYRHWHRVVAVFYTDGISEAPENKQLLKEERERVLNQYFRITRSLIKRNKRIQELDLPIMTILRKKLLNKTKEFFRFG